MRRQGSPFELARMLSAAVLASAVGLVATGASADSAAAQLLFEEGKALRERGQWPEACAKFRASMKLDPALGSLLNIANCHEREGLLASALDDYEQARVMNRATVEADRKQQIYDHIDQAVAALRPRVPMLSVAVSHRPDGLVVTRGERELPLEALDQPLPVDPGTIVLRARAEGFAGEARVVLRAGESTRVVIQLDRVAPAAAPPARGPGRDEPPTDAPIWPWALGAVGLALGGAAVGFGVWYQVTVDDMTDKCGGSLVPCRPEPRGSYDPAQDNDTKNRAAALTAVFAAAGGLSLAVAVVGLVVEAQADAPVTGGAVSVVAGPGEMGIGLRTFY